MIGRGPDNPDLGCLVLLGLVVLCVFFLTLALVNTQREVERFRENYAECRAAGNAPDVCFADPTGSRP